MPDYLRIKADKLIFDEKFREYLLNEKERLIEEAEKEVEYDNTLNNMKLEKIKKFYVNDVSCLSFGV